MNTFIVTLLTLTCQITSSIVLLTGAKSHITSYAALGDSYATGAGAGRSSPWFPHGDPFCGRFSDAYPVKMANDPRFAHVKFNNLACGGTTTTSVRLTQVPLIGDADIITLTVGGNEVEFFSLVNECVYLWRPTRGCEKQIEISKAMIEGQKFRQSFEKMLAAALEGKRSTRRLLVTSYARFFNDSTVQCDSLSFSKTHPDAKLTKALRSQLNGLMDALNDQIRLASLTQGAEYVNIDPVFEGHRFCEGKIGRSENESWFFRRARVTRELSVQYWTACNHEVITDHR